MAIAYIIIVAAIAYAIFMIGKGIRHYSKGFFSDRPSIADPGDGAWDWYDDSISLAIRGMQYYHPADYTEEGYIVAELDNQYDQHAIAVYTRKLEIIGHLPAGNWQLHRFLIEHGRYIPARIAVSSTEGLEGDERMYGSVYLDSGKYRELHGIEIDTGY